ncbi:predicted protein [Naegleria gruberi]|uniref:Predicted protein n=1 Tax=Naegleria gruberi TaxID=5762 RepID=D2VHB9_NAEGR|nr:uncharacterized protein NAEGRDRAFT_68162 [Naegleria gruberi]EFC43860.1 predicted protein [Naegleria gruberi]|eukprot:XP_002676604.1 predicted protein [Naegleria gruberi strain NEG-M]
MWKVATEETKEGYKKLHKRNLEYYNQGIEAPEINTEMKNKLMQTPMNERFEMITMLLTSFKNQCNLLEMENSKNNQLKSDLVKRATISADEISSLSSVKQLQELQNALKKSNDLIQEELFKRLIRTEQQTSSIFKYYCLLIIK